MEVKGEKIAIIGSRDWPGKSLALVREYVRGLPPFTTVVVGGGEVEKFAARIARESGLSVQTFDMEPQDAQREDGSPLTFGQRVYRNRQSVVAACDRAVCFWDGESFDGRVGIDLCDKRAKEVEVVYPGGTTSSGNVALRHFFPEEKENKK